MHYPTWLYKKVKSEMVSMLIKSELEHEAIGSGWADTPAAFDETEDVKKDEKKLAKKKAE